MKVQRQQLSDSQHLLQSLRVELQVHEKMWKKTDPQKHGTAFFVVLKNVEKKSNLEQNDWRKKTYHIICIEICVSLGIKKIIYFCLFVILNH